MLVATGIGTGRVVGQSGADADPRQQQGRACDCIPHLLCLAVAWDEVVVFLVVLSALRVT